MQVSIPCVQTWGEFAEKGNGRLSPSPHTKQRRSAAVSYKLNSCAWPRLAYNSRRCLLKFTKATLFACAKNTPAGGMSGKWFAPESILVSFAKRAAAKLCCPVAPLTNA